MKKTVICKVCNKEFISIVSKRCFCSSKCYNIFYNINENKSLIGFCKSCNKIFIKFIYNEPNSYIKGIKFSFIPVSLSYSPYPNNTILISFI